MFRFIIIFCIYCICLLVSANEIRSYNCRYLTASPVIDGHINEIAWDSINYSSAQFTNMKGENLFVKQTMFKIGYNAEGLFIGIKCIYPEIKKVRESFNKIGNKKIWEYDNVDIYIIPYGSQCPLHFIISSNRLKYFNLVDDYYLGKYISWASEVYYGDYYYSIELRIPWYSMLKIPIKNKEWMFNVGRTLYNAEDMTPTSWSPLKYEGYYQPDKFGILTFENHIEEDSDYNQKMLKFNKTIIDNIIEIQRLNQNIKTLNYKLLLRQFFKNN